MKILFLGDASNYHNSLAQELARRGHDVTVASNGSRWMQTQRSIDISRRKGKLGGAWLWTKLNTLLASRLKGYDVVQLIGPIFLELRPQRNRALFDKLKRDNGTVFMTMLGTDPLYVQNCLSGKVLKYSEWNLGYQPSPYAIKRSEHLQEWITQQMVDHARYVYDNVDGIIAALYEYYLSVNASLRTPNTPYTDGTPPKLDGLGGFAAYGGIAIGDTPAREPLPIDGKMRIMVACHKERELEKGIDLMLPPLLQLQAEQPDRFAVDLVQNVPFEQFKSILDNAHIVVDQLYSYTPATTALMAMARSKVVVSGGEPEYYDFISEDRLRPIINADPYHPDAFIADIKRLVDDPALYRQLALDSAEFAIKHNSDKVVADRFESFWTAKL